MLINVLSARGVTESTTCKLYPMQLATAVMMTTNVWPIESAFLTPHRDRFGEPLVKVKYVGCKTPKYVPKSYLIEDKPLEQILGKLMFFDMVF